MFFKFINFLSIYLKQNWCYKVSSSEAVDKDWISPLPIKYQNNFNFKKHIKLKTKTKINPGWYLLGIKIESNSKSVFFSFKNGRDGFPQIRKALNCRYAWRTIRINRKNFGYGSFSNVKEDLIIKDLLLIKIPAFDAWRRIKKRNRLFEINFSEDILKKISWVRYNKYFLENRGDDNNLRYQKWIREIEFPLILKYNDYELKDINFFQILDENNIRPVKKKEFIVFKYNDGEINFNAIKIIYKLLKEDNKCHLLYGDEDFIDKKGLRFDPSFKTAWNRELFFSDPFYANLWIIKANTWNKVVLKLFKKNQKVDKYQLLLELAYFIEKYYSVGNIKHLPYILFNNKTKNYADSKTKFTLINFLKKYKSFYGNVKNISLCEFKVGHHIEWEYLKDTKISIIIPIKDKVELLKNCLDSLKIEKLNLESEILIIDNNSIKTETKIFLNNIQKRNRNFKVLNYKGKFNYSAINNYASKFTNGNVLIFLNNDTKFITSNWAYELASNALRPGIGCVGIKLLYEDMLVQHAGVILGLGGVAGHPHKYFSEKSRGYGNRLLLAQEFSALTGACLAISKKNWEILGGFDSNLYKVNYNDVDLCLRAKDKNLRNIFIPSVKAFHYESKTRGKIKGKSFFQWKKEFRNMVNQRRNSLLEDPFYNQNLSLNDESLSINLKKIHNLKLRSSYEI